jgi:hypothetical protein
LLALISLDIAIVGNHIIHITRGIIRIAPIWVVWIGARTPWLIGRTLPWLVALIAKHLTYATHTLLSLLLERIVQVAHTLLPLLLERVKSLSRCLSSLAAILPATGNTVPELINDIVGLLACRLAKWVRGIILPQRIYVLLLVVKLHVVDHLSACMRGIALFACRALLLFQRTTLSF